MADPDPRRPDRKRDPFPQVPQEADDVERLFAKHRGSMRPKVDMQRLIQEWRDEWDRDADEAQP